MRISTTSASLTYYKCPHLNVTKIDVHITNYLFFLFSKILLLIPHAAVCHGAGFTLSLILILGLFTHYDALFVHDSLGRLRDHAVHNSRQSYDTHGPLKLYKSLYTTLQRSNNSLVTWQTLLLKQHNLFPVQSWLSYLQMYLDYFSPQSRLHCLVRYRTTTYWNHTI